MYTWTPQQILCLDKKMNFFRKVTRFQHSFFVAHPFCTIVINRSDISFLMKPCNLKPFAINWSDIMNSVHVAHLCPMSLRHPQLDSLLGSELRSTFFCASLFFNCGYSSWVKIDFAWYFLSSLFHWSVALLIKKLY